MVPIITALAVAGCNDSPANPPANAAKAAEPTPAAPREPATSAAAKPARPPSTGKEMPQPVGMTAAAAKQLVAETVALASAPKPDCEHIADTLAATLPIAYPRTERAIEPAAVPAYTLLQKCALDTQRWRAAVASGLALLPHAPSNFVVAQIPRALAELGKHEQAVATAKDLAAKFPGARESLMSAAVFSLCRSEAWEACLQSAEAMLAKLGANARGEGAVLGHLFRDLAWVVLGRPAEALADLEAIEQQLGSAPAFFAPVKSAAKLAVARGFHLEVVPVPQLSTGVYHLMGRSDTGALVTIKLREHSGATRRFRIEAEVPGVTDRSSNLFELGGRQVATRLVNPPLRIDFDRAKVRSPRPAQLALKIVELAEAGERTIIDETIPMDVLPADYLPLRRKVGADSFVPTFGYVGAWITSNDKTVEDFITKAKQRAPNRQFVGEQDATVPQVKALFDELKARGVTYVMDPNVDSAQAFVQRTRLPAEVLTTTNAQCLESTLTFATLMEAIGLQPVIVFVPGHAFVGWQTVAKDGTRGKPLFVETTMVGTFSFEQALKVATDRVAAELAANSFETGASTFVDVGAIRKSGFTAQPL